MGECLIFRDQCVGGSSFLAPNAALPARTGQGKDSRGEFRGSTYEPTFMHGSLNPSRLYLPSRDADVSCFATSAKKCECSIQIGNHACDSSMAPLATAFARRVSTPKIRLQASEADQGQVAESRPQPMSAVRQNLRINGLETDKMWQEEKMRASVTSLAGKRAATDAAEEYAKGAKALAASVDAPRAPQAS
eukprot:364639-Chlamydomonas_euryale.AAC.23